MKGAVTLALWTLVIASSPPDSAGVKSPREDSDAFSGRSDYLDEYAASHPGVLSYGPLLFRSGGLLDEDEVRGVVIPIAAATGSVTSEALKAAPYESLPVKYTDEPTSYYAVNTHVPDIKDGNNATEGPAKVRATTSTTKLVFLNTTIKSTHATVITTTTTVTTTTATSTTTTENVKQWKRGAITEDKKKDYYVAPEKNDSEEKPQIVNSVEERKDTAAVLQDHEGDWQQGYRKRNSLPIEDFFRGSTKAGFVASAAEPPLVSSFSGGYPRPEFHLPSAPVQSSFGVSVDFAGQRSDNPLYTGKNDLIYDVETTTRKPTEEIQLGSGWKIISLTTTSKPSVYFSYQPQTTLWGPSSTLPPTTTTTTTTVTSVFDPDLDTNSAPIPVVSGRPPPPPLPHRRPPSNVVRTLQQKQQQQLRRPHRPRPHFPPTVSPDVVARVSYVVDKLTGAQYGDNVLDAFDFVPLLALLIAAGLLLAQIFPNGITTLGLANNNGNLVINGKRNRRESEESLLDVGLRLLESGIAMVEEEDCSRRLACSCMSQQLAMGEDGILREFVVAKESNTAFLLELHCVQCRIEERRTRLWLTSEQWDEILALISPLLEDRLRENTEVAVGSKSGSKPEAIVLTGEFVRLACIFRRNSFDSLKLLQPVDASSATKLVLHSQKLVVGAALSSEVEADKLTRKAIGVSCGGANGEQDGISKYFLKSK